MTFPVEQAYFVQAFSNAGKGTEAGRAMPSPSPAKTATGPLRTRKETGVSKAGVIAFSSTAMPERAPMTTSRRSFVRKGELPTAFD